MHRATALAFFALAGCASTSAPPIWRNDTTYLAADKAVASACLERRSSELDACVFVIQDRCPGFEPPSQEALNRDDELTWAPSMRRRCAWRAIAAWEDLMDARLTALSTHVPPDQLRSSQSAWMIAMIADVRLASSTYSGGQMEGSEAAAVRAEAVARRAIWLERLGREARVEPAT